MSEQTASKALTGAKAVLTMRDEFLQLVTAYNAIGQYKQAAEAQAMAVALNAFEDEHAITDIAWPPRVESDEYGPSLVEVES